MSELKIEDVIHNPGRFCINPTDLTLDFPHGGQALGYISEIAYAPAVSYEGFPGEEYGEEFIARIRLQGTGFLTALLRQYDPDVISRHWPSTSATSDGNVTVTLPGSARSGIEITGTGVVLLFSPLDPRNPAGLFYNAVPELDAALEIRNNLPDELNQAVAWSLMRDATARAVALNTLDNLAAIYP